MSGSARVRLRFCLRRSSSRRRAWRCIGAFGDEPLGILRRRPEFSVTEIGADDFDEESFDEFSIRLSDDSVTGMSLEEPKAHVFQNSVNSSYVCHNDDPLSGRTKSFAMYGKSAIETWKFRSFHCNSFLKHYEEVPGLLFQKARKLSTMVVTPKPPFPSSISEMSAGWLTEILQNSRILAISDRISAFQTEQLGKGVGLVSALYRVHLKCAGIPVGTNFPPRSVVLKFGHTSPEVRSFVSGNNSYEREAGLYQFVSKLELEAKPDIKHNRRPLPTPSVHFAAFHKPSGSLLLCLEDLAISHRHLDQLEGATYPQALKVMHDCALSHAAFLPFFQPQSASLSWLPPHLNSELIVSFDSGEYPASWRVFSPHLPPLLEAIKRDANAPGVKLGLDVEEAVRKLGRLHLSSGQLLEQLGGGGRFGVPGDTRKGRIEPITLLHGDLRLDNIFLLEEKGAENGKGSVSLKYMDFGDCAVGRGIADVAYFLSQSLPPHVRRKHEKDLVLEYWGRFTESVAKSGMELDYEFDECWEDYRTGVLYYWILAVNIWSHIGPLEGGEVSRVRKLAQVATERSLSAILDLDCLDLVE